MTADGSQEVAAVAFHTYRFQHQHTTSLLTAHTPCLRHNLTYAMMKAFNHYYLGELQTCDFGGSMKKRVYYVSPAVVMATEIYMCD